MNTWPNFARPPRPPAWAFGVLAIVLVAGLTLAFLQVLQASVAGGAHRRQTVLDQEGAQWQCSRLAQRQARAECRANLPNAAGAP